MHNLSNKKKTQIKIKNDMMHYGKSNVRRTEETRIQMILKKPVITNLFKNVKY